MVNPRREPSLVEEHRDELLVVTQMRVATLDGNQPLESRHAVLVADEDGGHSARRQLDQQRVRAQRTERLCETAERNDALPLPPPAIIQM